MYRAGGSGTESHAALLVSSAVAGAPVALRATESRGAPPSARSPLHEARKSAEQKMNRSRMPTS
jgi:hypothetical protein